MRAIFVDLMKAKDSVILRQQKLEKKELPTVENEKFNNTKSKGNKIKTKQKNKTQKNSVAAPNLKSSVQQRK